MGPYLGPYPSLTGLGDVVENWVFQEIVHFDLFKTPRAGTHSEVLSIIKLIFRGSYAHKGP